MNFLKIFCSKNDGAYNNKVIIFRKDRLLFANGSYFYGMLICKNLIDFVT